MAFGCLASLGLWLVLLSALTDSMIPIALWVVFVIFRVVYHGLHSEWPLY